MDWNLGMEQTDDNSEYDPPPYYGWLIRDTMYDREWVTLSDRQAARWVEIAGGEVSIVSWG